MIPVPKERLEKVLGPIVRSQAEQYGFEIPEGSDHMMESLKACSDLKIAFSYVDDLDTPKSCLICTYNPSLMLTGIHATAYLVWVSPELRSSKAGLKEVTEMMEAFEEFGRMFNVESLMVSSWLYKGLGPSYKKLWPRFGFEPQELVMTKKINYK